MEQNVSRRGFIGAAIGTGAAAAMTTPAFAHGGGHDHGHGRGGSVPRDRRGIQMWTVRRLIDENLMTPGEVLRALGRMGYYSIEKFTNYGFTVEQFRRELRSAGLVCISGHDGPGFPATGNWEPGYRETLAYAKALGQKYTGLAWFDGNQAPYDDEATWHALAEHLNRAGRIAREYGLQFFYHNHNFEFENRFDDRAAYDILLEETDRRLVKFQLDLYWVTEGGGNGVEYLRADPGRFVSYHVKDHVWGDRVDENDWEDAGPGMLDFPDLFDAGDRTDKHYFIEHDWPQLSHPGDDRAELITAKVGIEYLRNVRW